MNAAGVFRKPGNEDFLLPFDSVRAIDVLSTGIDPVLGS